MATVHDISERKRVEEAIQASEARYRRLFEAAQDGILILDADTGRVVDVNPFLVRLLGYSYDALHGSYLWELGPFKDVAASKEAFQVLQDSEYIRYDDLPLEAHDGRRIDVEFVSNVYLVGQTKVIQCNIRDISERKRARVERERLHEQLAQAQKMDSVGRLAGGVAHDFNNMLGVILGHAELAQEQVDPAQPLYADLEEIRKAGQRSADLTRQLLAFARKQTVSPRILDLNEAITSMLRMLQRLIGEDIDLAWVPGHDLWPIKMDPSQLDQILANLCINARDAIAGVGRVTLGTENIVIDAAYCADHAGFVPGEFVILGVSDDGCGMSKEVQEHLFEPFFTTKEVGQGTGLGLATVYGIVKQNEGFVNVYSEVGQGTSFRIYLPRVPGQAVVAKAAGAAAAHRGHGETVLLVEDEAAILQLGKTMLQRLGYTVLVASAPEEALRQATTHPSAIHLLITDVVMPAMNGRDLAKQIMALQPGLKCLFMSGYTADIIAHRGVLEEGVRFLQKPFSLQGLADKVREALGAEGGDVSSPPPD